MYRQSNGRNVLEQISSGALWHFFVMFAPVAKLGQMNRFALSILPHKKKKKHQGIQISLYLACLFTLDSEIFPLPSRLDARVKHPFEWQKISRLCLDPRAPPAECLRDASRQIKGSARRENCPPSASCHAAFGSNFGRYFYFFLHAVGRGA